MSKQYRFEGFFLKLDGIKFILVRFFAVIIVINLRTVPPNTMAFKLRSYDYVGKADLSKGY